MLLKLNGQSTRAIEYLYVIQQNQKHDLFLSMIISSTLRFPEMLKHVRTTNEASLIKHNLMLQLFN